MAPHLVLMVFVPVAAGYLYKDSSGADRGVEPSREGVAALQSVHAQTGTREWDSARVGGASRSQRPPL